MQGDDPLPEDDLLLKATLHTKIVTRSMSLMSRADSPEARFSKASMLDDCDEDFEFSLNLSPPQSPDGYDVFCDGNPDSDVFAAPRAADDGVSPGRPTTVTAPVGRCANLVNEQWPAAAAAATTTATTAAAAATTAAATTAAAAAAAAVPTNKLATGATQTLDTTEPDGDGGVPPSSPVRRARHRHQHRRRSESRMSQQLTSAEAALHGLAATMRQERQARRASAVARKAQTTAHLLGAIGRGIRAHKVTNTVIL